MKFENFWRYNKTFLEMYYFNQVTFTTSVMRKKVVWNLVILLSIFT